MSRGYSSYSSGSGYKDSGPLDCKVYVGDLGQRASRNELEDLFNKYGELRNVWVARQPPGFAFVEFKDPRDALEAVEGTDGVKLNGKRIRVEMSSGESRRGGRGGGGYRGGGRRGEESCYECGERGHYARSCPNSRSRYDRRGYGRSSRYRSKSRSRSRSRSYSPRRRYSRSRSRSRSRD